jgi:hypothetical protein
VAYPSSLTSLEVAQDTRALIERGDIAADAALVGLTMMSAELRRGGASSESLAPLEDLIKELQAGNPFSQQHLKLPTLAK